MRIGFLLNHDQVHQVAHSVPIAAAIRQMAPAVELVVAVTNDRLAAEATRLAAKLGTTLPLLRLHHRGAMTRMAVRLLDGIAPVGRATIYRDNLDFFRSLDGLVVAEKTSLILKQHYGLKLPMIHTRHGAGDRAIGFDRASAGFDHVLVSGAKIRERLIADAGVAPERISVVGYPKFDLPSDRAALPFADPNRPIVLYSPHVSPHFSSWFRHGQAVLAFFAASDRYNLVFAPHVMLFQRPVAMALKPFRMARVGRVPAVIRAAPNIHVDLGSPACTDMSYTDAADLYLGDVSSQIYEYLHRPRPCLFLDSHHVRPADDPNYAAWAAGEVIEEPAGLGRALDRAFRDPARYRPVQERLLASTFDLTAEPSSKRAARAILAALDGG
jgi:hypothetical protein